MNILVVSQHYWPESFPSTELCEGLAARGHQVHVVTDVPNYPMGYIFPEYKKGKRRVEERNGVKIFRTFTIGRRNNILFRMLNYYSFAISSTLFCRRLKKEYDAVLAIQTSPIMMVSGALSYAKKHRKKCVFYTMDLWPASLAAGGIRESSPIYKFFGWVSKRLYRRADRILITSRMFRSYLQEQFAIDSQRIGYLPQYAGSQFESLPEQKEKQAVDLMFAGNVGAAQSIPTILQAAKALSDVKQLRFHIVGDGSELESSKALSRELGLENVLFHGRHPASEMPAFYAMADAMLVTLTADPFISLTLPAKVQYYMAAGKPIIGAADGEIPKVIADARCGFCGNAEDAAGLEGAIRSFLCCADPAQLGKNSRAYYEAHFTKELFMERLEQELC